FALAPLPVCGIVRPRHRPVSCRRQGAISAKGNAMIPGRWQTSKLVAPLWAALLTAAVLVCCPVAARAESTEQRVFTIQVAGKPAGDCQMTITRRDDGTETVSAQVNVRVKLILRYTFSYQGTEVWKNGRLLRLQSTCNDDGKRFEVNAS